MPGVEKPDQDWEQFGKSDPYFAVITAERYHKGRLNQQDQDAFYQSGEEYVQGVLSTIREHFAAEFNPARVLDFGCGVGRLTIPLARVAETVTGVDVSPAMLDLARARAAQIGLHNIEFTHSDDALSALSGKYDLILSSLVFQHIPPARGEKIFRRLLGYLNPGGICVVQFLYRRPHQRFYRCYYWLRQHVPFFKHAANVLQGRPVSAPFMQMNPYDMNRLLAIIQEAQGREVFCQLEEDEGFESVTVIVERYNQ